MDVAIRAKLSEFRIKNTNENTNECKINNKVYDIGFLVDRIFSLIKKHYHKINKTLILHIDNELFNCLLNEILNEEFNKDIQKIEKALNNEEKDEKNNFNKEYNQYLNNIKKIKLDTNINEKIDLRKKNMEKYYNCLNPKDKKEKINKKKKKNF